MHIDRLGARVWPLVALIAALVGASPAAAQAAAGAAPRGQERAASWVAEDEVFYQIFVRSFRDSDGDRIGDLRGIEQSLGYLQRLGVTSLLLTPINPSPFYHNYFASSFEGVDRAYGDSRALRALVQAVHARGMKIYLDEEIQYATSDHPWLAESAGRPGSRYSRFILYNGPGNTKPESAVFGITVAPMWSGVSVQIATVNLLEPAVRGYFERLFVSLVDPNGDGRFDDGVDGFRLDHMMDDLDGKGRLKHLFADFWAPVFARARSVNPRIRFIAEQGDWGSGQDYLTRGGVDLVFGFPQRAAVAALDARAIGDSITATLARMPAGKGQLTFIENHDMSRFASVVGGDIRKERIGAALTVLLKGTPLLYYGQELGMKGKQSQAWGTDANDIPDREAFAWHRTAESPGTATWYRDTGPWWTDRYDRDGDGISVEEQAGDTASLLSFYRRLLALRRGRPELRSGLERVVATDARDVLAVLRSTGTQASLLLVNLAGEPHTVSVARGELADALGAGSLRDLISGAEEPPPAEGVRSDLAPFGIKLLTARQGPKASRPAAARPAAQPQSVAAVPAGGRNPRPAAAARAGSPSPLLAAKAPTGGESPLSVAKAPAGGH